VLWVGVALAAVLVGGASVAVDSRVEVAVATAVSVASNVRVDVGCAVGDDDGVGVDDGVADPRSAVAVGVGNGTNSTAPLSHAMPTGRSCSR
jgi:hypothetical protein